MAIAKDIPEVYLCEYDTDRESITPYAGQKCIMQNGDIYVCIQTGVWGKIGTTPTPPVDPSLISVDSSSLTEDDAYWQYNSATNEVTMDANKHYALVLTIEGQKYTVYPPDDFESGEIEEGQIYYYLSYRTFSNIPEQYQTSILDVEFYNNTHLIDTEYSVGGYIWSISLADGVDASQLFSKITKFSIQEVEI